MKILLKIVSVLLFLGCYALGQAQNITHLEYFIDQTDPGFGLANNVVITPDIDLQNNLFNVDISGLNPGIHTLHLRSKDANENWSLLNAINFVTTPNPAEDVVAMEYFIDNNDPGVGLATAISVTPNTNIPNKIINVNIAGLSAGLHTLHLRSKDTAGKWSLLNAINFVTTPNPTEDVVAMEYFIDNNDPGVGLATAISVTPNTNIPNKIFNVNIAGLSAGLHKLHLRSKNAAGKWSLLNAINFVTTPNPAEDVVAMEYFIDNNDPGVGLATAISVTPNANIPNKIFNVNIAGLNAGLHTLHLRSKDAAGKWSLLNAINFVTTPNTLEDVVAMEYYIDNNDPGIGLAQSLTISSNTDIANSSFNVDLSNLTLGMHTLYIRSKNAIGEWSVTSKFHFIRYDQSVANINQFEYFINDDPGIGNGTTINPAAATDINNFTINVDISALTADVHKFFIRSLETGHTWSLTNQLTFTSAPLPVELLDFNAKLVARDVALDWKTTTEINNEYFDIEHSMDGIQYSKLGKIAGAGNSSLLNYYFHLHKNPAIGLNYYRLKQVDFDGTFEYSEVKVVHLAAFKEELVIYPVPAIDQITATSNFVNEGEYSYEIFNSSGRLEKVILGYSSGDALSNVIDISSLAGGHYILRLKAQKQIFIQSFVKN